MGITKKSARRTPNRDALGEFTVSCLRKRKSRDIASMLLPLEIVKAKKPIDNICFISDLHSQKKEYF